MTKIKLSSLRPRDLDRFGLYAGRPHPHVGKIEDPKIAGDFRDDEELRQWTIPAKAIPGPSIP